MSMSQNKLAQKRTKKKLKRKGKKYNPNKTVIAPKTIELPGFADSDGSTVFVE